MPPEDSARDASGNKHIFQNRGGFFTSKEEKDWKQLMSFERATRKAFASLLKYIRQHYPEIDVDQASREAWAKFIESEKDLRRTFAD